MAGIQLIAEIEPKNSGSFALLDDKYMRGGLRVVETYDELASIPSDRLKDGCLSMVTTPSRVLYVYDQETDTWSPFSSGGGGGGSDWLCVEDGETTKLVKDVDTWTQKIVVINHIKTYADYFALPTEYIQNNEVAYCKADVMEGTTTYKKGLYSYDVEKASWVEVNSTIEIDSALSETSKRPVQNRVVTKALEEKVSKDDVDNVISRFSENPIQNKAVATALENIKPGKTMTAEEYESLDDETKNDDSFYYISDTGEIYQNGIIYGGKQVFDVTQEEYDALTDEEKSNNEYHCTDTGRTYINGILYGDKKPIEMTYEEYKQLEVDGLVEPDVDYIIVSDQSGVLLTSTDVAYSDTLTVKGKFDEVDEAIDGLIDDENTSTDTVWSSKKTSDELANVNKVVQGKSIFDEMYHTTNPYRKLSVKVWYARAHVFEVHCGTYFGKITVHIHDKASIEVTDINGTRPFELKYNDYTSISDGVYLIDLFIHKTNTAPANAIIINPVSQGIEKYSYLYTSDDFVISTVDEFTSATHTPTYNKIASINDTTTSTTSTWSSSKIKSQIVGTKTQYIGSKSVDINTGGKMTFIFSSTYSTSAGAYLLLSNYNVTPTLIELGRHPEKRFTVTATNKSPGIDTITVTIPDEYHWYILQF